MSEHYDVAIIGAGPAGLTAATDLALAGKRVVVIDENWQVGGKLRGQLHEEPDGHWWNGPQFADDLERAARNASVTLLLGTVVWKISPGWTVHVTAPAESQAERTELTAERVLVATGAVERPLPFEGWTTPGVMTIGAAQVLTNIHRVQPGKRVLVVGMDALSLTIARAMQLGGVEVVAIVLPPPSSGVSPLRNLGRLAPMAKLAPAWYMRAGAPFLRFGLLRSFAARLLPRRIGAWGMPLMLRTAVTRVEGDQTVAGVELVDVTANGTPKATSKRVLEVDAVAVANGLSPLNELLAPLATTFVRARNLGGVVPVYDEFYRTEHPGLYLAGNAAGIEGAKMAIEQGHLVAQTILHDSGTETVSEANLLSLAAKINQTRHAMEFQFDPNVEIGLAKVAQAWRGQATHASAEEAAQRS